MVNPAEEPRDGLRVVVTAKVIPRRYIESYKANLSVDFQTVPCNTEDEIITVAQDADSHKRGTY